MTKELTEHQHYLAIGSIVTYAANADLVLFNTFWRISGTTLLVASCIYYGLDAMPVKTRMIAKVAKYQCNHEQRALVKQVSEAASKANNQRIAVAHSARVEIQGRHLAANPRQIDRPTAPITASAFQQMSDDAFREMRAADAAHQKLCKLLKVSPQLQIAHDRE